MPRKYTRLHVPAEITVIASIGSKDARISDLSMGGCFIESIIGVVEGETAKLELKVSADESILIGGKVVYSMQGIGFGVRFDDLTDEHKFHLEHLILKNGGTTHEISDDF